VAKVASAKRHAQAVFQIAQERKGLEKWRSELKTIADTFSDPDLGAVLENPKVRLTDKVHLIDKLLPDLSQLARNFACLMVAKQRLGILDQVVAEYERMADAHEGLEHAHVTTAVSLDKEDGDRLVDRLAQMTGKRIVLASDVDPSIIGGFVARIGDKLVDGSTRARLEALKKRLVETAH
jgi:F-type H+-transporting ATPase subunit delta